jgi:hypothetical protein
LHERGGAVNQELLKDTRPDCRTQLCLDTSSKASVRQVEHRTHWESHEILGWRLTVRNEVTACGGSGLFVFSLGKDDPSLHKLGRATYRVSLCSPHWPRTQDLLPQHSEYWDYRHAVSHLAPIWVFFFGFWFCCLFFAVLGVEFRASSLLPLKPLLQTFFVLVIFETGSCFMPAGPGLQLSYGDFSSYLCAISG